MAAIPTYEVNGPNAGLTKFNEPRCQETHLFFGQCALPVDHDKRPFAGGRAHNPMDSRTSPTYSWNPQTGGSWTGTPQEKIAVSSTYGKPQPDSFLSLLLLVLLSELLAPPKDKNAASKPEHPDDEPNPVNTADPNYCDGCGRIHNQFFG